MPDLKIIVSIAKIDNNKNNNNNNGNKSNIDVVCSAVKYSNSRFVDVDNIVNCSKKLEKDTYFFHKNGFTIINFGFWSELKNKILYKDRNIQIIYFNIFKLVVFKNILRCLPKYILFNLKF